MDDQQLRANLLELLDGDGAHMRFEEAVADFPDGAINAFPPNVPYTPWHLVEHLRLTQVDMLEYVLQRDYHARRWPDEYWPSPDERADRAQFDASVRAFLADRAALRALVADEARDLFAVIRGTPGHSLLRGVRIIADHNAYHVGEFAVLRQVMGTWPTDREE